MTSTEKLLLGLGLGGIAYFLLAGKGSAKPPIIVPGRAETAIMENYSQLIWSAAVEHNVDPAIIAAMVWRESRGNPNAQGVAGEIGLMQILPSTGASECGVGIALLREPRINLKCGANYLRRLLDVPRLKGSVAAALAAYNGGLSRVYLKNDKITAPNSVKAYSYNVMLKVPYFRDAFRRVPQYAASYGVIFRWSDFQLDLKQTL